jgi:small conductance mechanosensitive channel
MEPNLASIDQIKHTAIDLGMNFGPKLVVALLILVAGYFAGRWVGKVLGRGLTRFELEPPVRLLLVRLVRVLVLALFGIMALQNLGIELLPLIAGLGVLGAGVALATQGVLSNVVAGLTVIFTKPFRVGEYVSLLGEEGEVLQITLFSTTLGHPDRSRVVIPNRKVVGEILHNHGRMRQIEVTVGVAYDTDLHRAVAEIDEILRANPRVLQDPRPLIAVTLLGESSIDIVVKPWVRVPDYEVAHGEVNQAIVERFRAGGIVIPFPQREVRMLAAVAGT